MERGSGLLLSITALPSKYGIGNFGVEAKRFVKLLKLAGQKYWQIMPINDAKCSNLEVSFYSTFALNPYFIDLEHLVKKGYLKKEELVAHTKNYNNRRIDFNYLHLHRLTLLKNALVSVKEKEKVQIQKFYAKNKFWLEDYALFMCLKEKFNYLPWCEWPNPFKEHNQEELVLYKEKNLDIFEDYVAMQYLAFSQYLKLKKYAKSKNIKIIGAFNFSLSWDSVDVWSNQDCFALDKNALMEKKERKYYKFLNKGIKNALKLYDLLIINEKDLNAEKINNYIFVKLNNFEKSKLICEGVNKASYFEVIRVDSLINKNSFFEHEKSILYLNDNDNCSLINKLRVDDSLKDTYQKFLNVKGMSNENIVERVKDIMLKSNAHVTIFSLQDILFVKNNSFCDNENFRFKKSDFLKNKFLNLYQKTCQSKRY